MLASIDFESDQMGLTQLPELNDLETWVSLYMQASTHKNSTCVYEHRLGHTLVIATEMGHNTVSQ